jgi:hypothetical protein
MERVRFCRDGGLVTLYGVRMAFVRFSRTIASVLMTNQEPSLPDLVSRGVHGCTRTDSRPGGIVALFPRAAQRKLLAELGEAFDVVVDERRAAEAERELEFIAALIEWGCGPLPTLGELIAYDRGLADAERLVQPRLRAERNSAAAWSAEHVARLRGEIENLRGEIAGLRATVERQRAELIARPVDTGAFERARRQQEADVALVDSLIEDWRGSLQKLEDIGPINERVRVEILRRIDGAAIVATALREREVVQ